MPGTKAARLPAVIGGVGEDGADEWHQPRLFAETALPLLEAVAEILLEHWIVEGGLNVLVVLRLDRAVYALPFRKGDPDVLRLLQFVVASALLARSSARSDADQVDRAMAR